MTTPRLPSLVRDWQLDINNAVLDRGSTTVNHQDMLYQIKKILTGFAQNPWTVHSSSNSVSAGSSDLWSDYTDVVHGTGNHAWIVLNKPIGSSQLLISADAPDIKQLTLIWSPEGLFTGGSISANPTATDQVTLQSALDWMGALTSPFNSWLHVWHSSDGYCTRIMTTHDTNEPKLFWILDQITDPFSNNWVDLPEVMFILENVASRFSSSSTFSVMPITENAGKSWNGSSSFDVGFFSLGHNTAGTGGTNWEAVEDMGSLPNPLNTDLPYPICPIGITSDTVGTRGVHGMLVDLYVGHTDRTMGSTYPLDSATKEWVQFGDIILPWTNDSTIPLATPTVTQGTIDDVSSYSNVGTPNGMNDGDFNIDTPGGSFSVYSSLFNGAQYVGIGDVSPLQFDRTDPFSISAWFKTTLATGTAVLVSKLYDSSPTFPGYELVMDCSTGQLWWQLANDFSTSNVMRIVTILDSFNDDVWHHIVTTWDGDVAGGSSGASIYIDGYNEPVTAPYDGLTSSISSLGALTIGARDNGANHFFSGRIDDVAIYDKALSSTEVNDIYNSGIPNDLRELSSAPNLVGYWLMGENVLAISDSETTINGVLADFGSTKSAEEITAYRMVGVDTGAPGPDTYYHFWTVTNSPDTSGAQTTPPYGGPLTNIYVSAQYKL